MSNGALSDQIAGANAYEQLHVPALFGEWAEPLLDAARVAPGQRVLDVACGTGVLARAASARVGDPGSVAGVDPDPGMLAVAERLAPGVAFRPGTAEALPFPDASFDVVASQFGMMFFADREGAVREMLRVLRSGGRLAVAVWDSLDNSAAYAAEVELLERMAGSEAADALRAPFVLGDRDELSRVFERAGADAVAVTTRTGTARFPSVHAMVAADLRGWLPVMGVRLPEQKIQAILAEAEKALERFVLPDGTVVFDAPGHIVTGARA